MLYQTEQREVIPGEYFDWDIPASRYRSTRIMRSRISRVEPEVLVETEAPTWFATGGPHVFYGLSNQNGGPVAIQSIHLETGAKETLSAKPEGMADVSPDGGVLAWNVGGTAVRLYDVANGDLRSLQVETTGNLGWVSNDRLVITRYDAQGASFRVANRKGEVGPEVAVVAEGMAFGIGKAGGADLISPGGKWAIGVGKGKDPGAPIVSLETGKVHYSNSFAWRAWLNDETLIAINGDGVYTMPLNKAIDLP